MGSGIRCVAEGSSLYFSELRKKLCSVPVARGILSRSFQRTWPAHGRCGHCECHWLHVIGVSASNGIPLSLRRFGAGHGRRLLLHSAPSRLAFVKCAWHGSDWPGYRHQRKLWWRSGSNSRCVDIQGERKERRIPDWALDQRRISVGRLYRLSRFVVVLHNEEQTNSRGGHHKQNRAQILQNMIGQKRNC